MPSFGKKLNPSGHSPLDLALHNGHRETVKQLIKFDPELIRVRSRERKTPLHYVAETDDSDLVAEFLLACPTAIKELTIRGETAVHLAVLRGSRNAFQVLMGWITRTDKDILGWKDNKGNTLLHIATLTSKIEGELCNYDADTGQTSTRPFTRSQAKAIHDAHLHLVWKGLDVEDGSSGTTLKIMHWSTMEGELSRTLGEAQETQKETPQEASGRGRPPT